MTGYKTIQSVVGKWETTEEILCEAIELLKQCVNYEGKPMTAAIGGQLGDSVKEFIKRYELETI